MILETFKHPEPFVALRAANTIDHLREKARPLLPQIKSFLSAYEADPLRQKILGANFSEWTLRRTVERLVARR